MLKISDGESSFNPKKEKAVGMCYFSIIQFRCAVDLTSLKADGDTLHV